MKVIIAEKPSVARDIARVLKSENRNDGYISGNGYAVTWAIGHLVRLADPVVYKESLKRWNISDLPILPDPFITEVESRDGIKQQYQIIKKLLLHKDTTEVICATDAGREGELIFRYIYNLSGCDKPIKRLWISSQTDEALLNGFANLKDGKEYETLYYSAVSRSESDWIIGINSTRAYTIRYGAKSGVMSVGRVQTPVLNMIVERHKEFSDFKPQIYYEIEALIKHENGSFKARLVQKDRIFDKEKAQQQVAELEKFTQGAITKVTKKAKTEKQPYLYDLTELQKDANRRYKFSADKTLKLIQALYEKHKVVTYPRTSSRFLSNDIKPKIKGLMQNLKSVEPYQKYAEEILSKTIKTTKRVFDDKKVTDHHAIIPTEKKANINSFSDDEFKVFDLIIKRFFAAFMDECKKELTDIVAGFEKYKFQAKGSVLKKAGWREVYMDEKQSSDSDQLLPAVAKDDVVSYENLELQEKKTKAPALYTEASILAAMETAGKNIDDDDLREAMKDCGLGTPATRAQILERLIKVNYIVREKNKLIPTEKGINIISLIKSEELLSPEMTGQWEKKLNDIRLANYSRDSFMKEIRDLCHRVVKGVKFSGSNATARENNTLKAKPREAIATCPLCGGDIYENSKAFGCSNWKEKKCPLTIWKKIAGNDISQELALKLINDGKTEKVEGFKSRKGTDFGASLILKNGQVKFDFA